MNDQRLYVRKTCKLCIGGSFVRSESRRVTPALTASGATLDHFSRASRKDLRDAVSAARSLTTTEWFSAKAEDSCWILDTVEFKTTWHPIGV
jgi:hypothetical protein